MIVCPSPTSVTLLYYVLYNYVSLYAAVIYHVCSDRLSLFVHCIQCPMYETLKMKGELPQIPYAGLYNHITLTS